MKFFVVFLIAFLGFTAHASTLRLLPADGFLSSDLAKQYNLPSLAGSSDTLVTLGATQTLTGKTISGGSNTLSSIGDSSLSVSYIKADGTRAFTGDQSMGSHKLTNVTDPSSAQDAATKAYVDAHSVGPSISGSAASPNLITAGGGVAFSSSNYSNITYIKGSGGPVTITAVPQIAACTVSGQTLMLIGEDSTNTVTIVDDPTNGVSQNGPFVAALNSVIEYVCDSGLVWVEQSRR